MSNSETIQQYKCPNCAAELRFDPKKQGFSCEYCDSFFTPEECKAANARMDAEVREAAAQRDEFAESTNLYICPSCGAELMTDQNTAATECYYCHNPVVLKGRLSGEYRPASVIPFKIGRDEAQNIFRTWCRKRRFLPKSFTAESQLLHMQGVYVPFWVAKCDVHGNMHAVCKKVRSWTSGSYHYTETKEFDVIREASLTFDGIPADGASKIEDALMEAIEPFDYGQAVDFEMSYLSGFLSDKYDVNRSQVFPRVRNRAVNGSDQMLRGSIVGYSSIRVTNSDVHILNTRWQYMLLPVWFMTYQYKGKQYEFAINGQSGKQAGTPPLAAGKLAAVCACIPIAAGLIGFLGGLFS
jgi:DNA-directed RNA polymerase subunit RPC12/RpoP